MATSPETFNQVKNILRKLDRSIDDIRSRRATPAPAMGPAPKPSVATSPSVVSTGSNVPPGRARPLGRDPRTTF